MSVPRLLSRDATSREISDHLGGPPESASGEGRQSLAAHALKRRALTENLIRILTERRKASGYSQGSKDDRR